MNQTEVLNVLEAIVLAIASKVFRETSLSFWLKPALPMFVIGKSMVLVKAIVVMEELRLGWVSPHADTAKASCLHCWEIIRRWQITIFSLTGLIVVGIHLIFTRYFAKVL